MYKTAMLKCTHPECDVYATFGHNASVQPISCLSHKNPDMIRLAARICSADGCENKSGCATLECVNHRQFVVCGYPSPECPRRAHWTDGVVVRCGIHKSQGMAYIPGTIDRPGGPVVVSDTVEETATVEGMLRKIRDLLESIESRPKRPTQKHDRYCIHPGCYNVSLFGYVRDKMTHCVLHRAEDMPKMHRYHMIGRSSRPTNSSMMTARLGPSCELCDIPARHAMPNATRPRFCLSHREVGMINVCDRLCAESGCAKMPCYRNLGGTYSEYCTAHKKPGMLSIAQIADIRRERRET